MAGSLNGPKSKFNPLAAGQAERLRHFAVWDDHSITFFEADESNHVRYTPETLERAVDSILERMKSTGVMPIRLHSGSPQDVGRPILNYQFFFIPDVIDCWADYIDISGSDPEPALLIEDIPFYLSREEIADFNHELRRQTPENDWIEFAPDAEGPLQSLDGRFGFRKSRIVGIIAAPELPELRIAMANGSELLIPLQNAAAHIHEIAAMVPGLHAIPAAEDDPRIYGDPDHYPELRPAIPAFVLHH